MKKALLVVSKDIKLTNEIRKSAEKYAREQGAMLYGTMIYPNGLPIIAPNVMLEAIRECDADVVISADLECLLAEIIHEQMISKSLEQKGVEFYDLNFKSNMNQVINELPEELLNELNDTTRKIRQSISEKENNVMVISKHEDRIEASEYMKELMSSNEVRKVCSVEVNECFENIESILQSIIDSNDINHITVYSSYNSLALYNYMDKLSKQGMHIESKYQQDLNSNIHGMMMN